QALATAGHWVRQVRETVRFADAVAHLSEGGARLFLAVDPSASLAAAAEECVPVDAGAVFTSCADPRTTLDTLAALHVHGGDVDWRAVYADSGARRLPLPTYPFQRQRYWLDAVRQPVPAGHPLIGHPQPDADGPRIRHTAVLSTTRHPWLADHRVGDRTLAPATLFAELAARATGADGPVRLTELAFHKPLVLPPARPMRVQVVTDAPDASGERPVEVWARPADGTAEWTRHATATLAPPAQSPPPADPGGTWPPAGARPVPVDYPRLAAHGLHYGPAFRAVTALWQRDDEVYAELALPPGEAATAAAYTLHPALFDAALHAAALADAHSPAPATPRVPLACTGVTVFATGASA
ncbi:polyketide synthase dehydratase domain-containing protein, partial [Streptomyces sp. NPDC052610]|uniref:polyketide synthase dehydratase domain-containing protein n=1 Tax=Streptomyces sp. NPDC052610 TaxID=3154952 RepID=UPI00342FE7CA